MTTPGVTHFSRSSRLLPQGRARRAALAWALGVAVVLVLAGSRAGLGEAEGRIMEAARRQGAWWVRLPVKPLDSLYAVNATFGPEAGAAALPIASAGVGHALLGGRLPGGEVLGYRLAEVLLAAFLAYVLSRFAADLSGVVAALLAPALFFLSPASLDASLPAGTDLAAAALWLGVLLAHSRGLRSRDHRERIRRATLAGLLFGAAVATRREAWILLPLLAFHYLAVRARGGIRALTAEEEAPRHPAGRSPWRSLVAGLPSSLAAMLVLGPVVFVALTPWTWVDPLRRLAPAAWATLTAPAYASSGGVAAAPPWHAPLLAALLLPPASLTFLYLAGLAHTGRRLVLGWRGEAAASFPEELLLLLGALAPLVLAPLGVTPAGAGVGPALPALAVLSVLGARALATAARAAWPSTAGKLAVAVVLLSLYPPLRATLRTFPHGGAAWGEWVGGAPGAASLGLPRGQAGAGATLLRELSERAAPGQRLWWPRLSPAALDALRRDGRIRADLRLAPSAAEADLALVEHDAARRDLEFQAWTAFETARPVAEAALDEVPLAAVYARPGAWR
ncbi:MAG TPA: hypothetical protein VLT47_08885 [Anaeromyxobacteraceae bacterium]|nr:hypothetical protein [Anaeromyxobacteraceae bacterium]